MINEVDLKVIENEEKSYKFQKLTPVNDGDINIYSEAFNFVFSENDLRNIAITGPYSAGKSSVLETYKKLNEKKKFIHISLAHFEMVDKNEENEDYDESVLEGKILNQLIHQIDSKNIPQTHFKIKRKPSKVSMIINTALIMLFLIITFYLLGYDNWDQYVNALSESGFKSLLKITLKEELMSITGFSGFMILMYWIFTFVKMQKERNLLRKVSFHGNEIEIFEKTDESYFDKYLNEVLYVFQNAKADAIVFEDVDRFNSNKIFEKLREINYLLNKKSENCIRFFYLLRDDIFTTKDRTKFFDFILPIVPVIDGSNSYDQFIEHFKNGRILEKFDESFLQGLSLYIDDMRILKNIYNEFVIYHERIQSTELNANKLLALITLKNLFPRDFSELQLSRGFVYSLFSDKDEFIKKEISKIDSQIQHITSRINDIDNEMLEDIDELDAIFLVIGYGTINVNGKNERQFNNRTELVKAMKATPNSVTYYNGRNSVSLNINHEISLLSNKPDYVARKEAIEGRAENRMKKFQAQIAALENDKHVLKNKKLYEIITRENIKDIFSNVVTDEVGKKHQFIEVKSNPYFSLIKYLIRNGYIDETYPDYLTYFYENSLSRIDKIFLRSVSDQEAKDFGYELKDRSLVVSRLRDVDFSCEETLNFTLVEYLLSTEHDFLRILLKQLKNNKRFDFIWQFTERSEMAPKFIKELHHQWSAVWSTIENEEVFNVEQKKQYMVYTIYYTENEDILAMNEDQVITHYLSENPEFLDISEPDVDRIISVLSLVGTKFQKITFESSNIGLFKGVYESHLYELNFDMLSLIIKEIYNEKSVTALKHSNFSILDAKPQEPLLSYVNENINQYMDIILEHCDGTISDVETSALKLINNPNIDSEKRVSYIKCLETNLTNISDVTEDSLWEELMKESRMEYSTENILDYYFSYSGVFDTTLVDFVNGGTGGLDFDYNEILVNYDEMKVEDFITKVVQCNELKNDKYRMLLRSCNAKYNSFEFPDVQINKIQYLIDSRIISFTQENTLFIREHYSDQMLSFAVKNIKEYVELIDGELFVFDELIHLLRSTSISDNYKVDLLDKTTNVISIRNEKFSDTVLLHILQHNFDIDDLTYIVEEYSEYSEIIKNYVDELTIENVDRLMDNQVKMLYEQLIKVLSTSTMMVTDKWSLYANQLPYLNKEEAMELLNIIEAEDFLSLFTGKRPKIEISPVNETILDLFVKRRWITKYKVDENEPEYYRAYGRKNQVDEERLSVPKFF